MTTQDKDKWVARAQKLFAMAEGAKAVGNEEEAASFMDGLQKLLMAQKLDWSVLDEKEQQEIDPMMHVWHSFDDTVGRKKRRQAWVEKLARFVANSHFCNMIVGTATNSILFVGRSSDVQVARYMLDMLVRIGKTGADKAYRKARYHKWKVDAMHEAHGFRSAFLLGYTERLGERLYEMHRREVEADRRMALVVVRSKEEIIKYTKENIATSKAAHVGMSASGHRDAIDAGRAMGRSAADAVNLNTKGVGAGASPKQKHLGRVPKMLGRGDAKD